MDVLFMHYSVLQLLLGIVKCRYNVPKYVPNWYLYDLHIHVHMQPGPQAHSQLFSVPHRKTGGGPGDKVSTYTTKKSPFWVQWKPQGPGYKCPYSPSLPRCSWQHLPLHGPSSEWSYRWWWSDASCLNTMANGNRSSASSWRNLGNEREGERECMCVCVCVSEWVRKRERERES